MSTDAIVRVSFESDSEASKAANRTLVGHRRADSGPGPFVRVNTAVYLATACDDDDVLRALAEMLVVLQAKSEKLDFVSISVTTRKNGARLADPERPAAKPRRRRPRRR